MDLIANYRTGALSIAVSGKAVRPAQVDDNGVVIVADNRLLQFSVMKVASRSGKVVSGMDSRQILEAHRQSRVSFIKTLIDRPLASKPGTFSTLGGRDYYFWHVDIAPASGKGKAAQSEVRRQLHATTMAGDMIAIFIIPITPLDDENNARNWLERTVATLKVHSKPFVRDNN